MGIVTKCDKRTSKAGRDYYMVEAEGIDKPILSFNFMKLGDQVVPDNLELNDKGDTFKFKAGSNGKAYQANKKGYERNDDLIVAQVAFKSLVDLAGQGKLDMFDAKGNYRHTEMAVIGVAIANTIKHIAANLMQSKPKAE